MGFIGLSVCQVPLSRALRRCSAKARALKDPSLRWVIPHPLWFLVGVLVGLVWVTQNIKHQTHNMETFDVYKRDVFRYINSVFVVYLKPDELVQTTSVSHSVFHSGLNF